MDLIKFCFTRDKYKTKDKIININIDKVNINNDNGSQCIRND